MHGPKISNFGAFFDRRARGPAVAAVLAADVAGYSRLMGANEEGTLPYKYKADGSLDLYFQNESPGADRESNWLPAPKDSFNFTMRIYAPKSDALTGKWNPPLVKKILRATGLIAQ